VTEIPEGFPHDASDRELATFVRAAAARYRDINWDRLLPELRAALIQAALQEQSRRAVETAERSARRSTRLSLTVSSVALAVALVGSGLTYFGDRQWQRDQSRLLNEIRQRPVSSPGELRLLRQIRDKGASSRGELQLLREIRDRIGP
jgi:transposase-like protein